MDLESRLLELCEPLLNESGYELVWVQVAGVAGRQIARIFIDKPGGVSVEDCAAASRMLEPLIEGSDVFQGSYNLEVSSPGLERPLFKSKDYERFIGRKARLRLRQPIGNRRNFSGILRGLKDETHVLIELEGGELREIPLGQVQRANLVFEWK